MAGLKRTDNKGRILKDGETQRPNGRYRFTYTDADGVRHDVYSSRLVPTDKLPPGSKEDLSLREKEKKILRDLEDGIKAAVENKATLNDLFDIYMADKPQLKETTRTSYLYLYNKFVRDDLGKKKITSVKYSDVKSFYNRLVSERKLKPNSLKMLDSLIRSAFNLAVRDGYIRINPCNGAKTEVIRNHDLTTSKRHSLSIAEQSAFIDFIRNHKKYSQWLPLFTVFLGTGCRISEIIGLRWEDCDFDDDIISINHSMVYCKFKGDTKMCFHITTPKTSAGIRIVPMLPEVKEALKLEWGKQEIIGFNRSVVDGYTGFIFQSSRGNPLSHSDVNYIIKSVCAAYNKAETSLALKEGRDPITIRHFSAHNLRHTFCTRYCEVERDTKVIQEVMGHTNITTTMNIYAEATKEAKKKSFERLKGKFKIS